MRIDHALGLGPVRRASGLHCVLASRLSAHLRAHDSTTPDDLARLGAHVEYYSGSDALAQSTTPSCSSGLYRFSLVKRSAALPASGKLGGRTTTARCCLWATHALLT